MLMNEPENNQNKVLVALSGGVDSAVCARLLQLAGYDVEGLVISFSPAHASALDAAQKAAAELSIPLHVSHVEERFEEHVVTPFCKEYAAGRTPNPCVVCNPLVKFHTLVKEADRRGISRIASGHYARITEYGGRPHITRAVSAARDQSYMLYRLPPEIQARLLLPLGEYEKGGIRGLAAEYGLSSADAPDSQEICFIPNGGYAAFIEKRGIRGKQGRFISPGGMDLGPHKGVLHYTIGQRRGTGLSLGKPVFVKRIVASGDILLGWAGDEYAAAVTLTDMVMADGQPPRPGDTYTVKLRSVAKAVPCTVADVAQNGCRLLFAAPQRAPAPGQHAVLYRDMYVMGGGVINETD